MHDAPPPPIIWTLPCTVAAPNVILTISIDTLGVEVILSHMFDTTHILN